ncbi:MAG: T9SS type A sorting domain-containing protein [Bacteroidota bacterium]
MTTRFSLATLFVALFALTAAPAVAQQADVSTGGAAAATYTAPAPFSAPSAVSGSVLYDNGPLTTSTGTGAGGADESLTQDVSLNMQTFGWSHQFSTSTSVSDNFTVPAGGWDIDEMVFYAYQTGSPTTSTMTGVYVRIWDGSPDNPASTVVFGDLTTNRLTGSAWTGIYRVTESTFCPAGTCTDRPIMADTAAVDVTLPAGNYWVEWSTDGSLGSGPWAPPVTVIGQTTTGNALQFFSGSWQAIQDQGTLTPQDFPFQILGPAKSVTDISIAVNTSDSNPTRNESVFFRGPVTNNGSATEFVYVYFTVDVPGFGTYQRNLGGLFLDPGQTVNYRDIPGARRKNFVPVPPDAPAGTYTVTVVAATDTDGTTVFDSDSFQFTLPPLTTKGGGALVTGEVGASPNPFRGATEIRYALAEDAEVDLRVYDVTGREVAVLASGSQSAGSHAAVFTAEDLPGGVYVWRLAIGAEVTTGRVTLAR